MYTRVSRELRDKIADDLQEVYDMSGDIIGIVTFTTDKQDRKLREECIEWLEHINTYYKSSYWGGALKTWLHYKYIKPIEVAYLTVTFDFEYNYNQSWKDWFIRRDYASIVPA